MENAVKKAIEMALNLPSIWKEANFNGKRKLQVIVFPEGISYNIEKDDYRTL
jgi:hypothetical protein